MNGDIAVRQIQKNISKISKFMENCNSSQAVPIMEKPKHFDVIILDLDMPILNGYEACK